MKYSPDIYLLHESNKYNVLYQSNSYANEQEKEVKN